MISSQQTEGTEPVSSLVTKLNMNDVLFGRGAPAIDNEGNIRLRRIVSGRRAEYFSAAKRTQKDQIARQVASAVKSQGGRFLRKIEDIEQAQNLGIQEGDNAWIIVDEDTVLTKVKQALRDRNADDEETRPRRRKRVRNGNLVPDEDDHHQDQKMETTEDTSERSPSLENFLYRQRLPMATAVSDVAGNITNSRLSYESALGATRESQLDALLRQIGQAGGFTGIPFSSRSDAPLRAPTLIATNLALPRLPSGGFYGEPGRYTNSLAGFTDLFSFRVPERLQVDPLLGSVNPIFRTADGLMTGLASSIPPQQDQSARPHAGRACTEILFEAFTKPKPPQSQMSGSRSLSVSLFETSLIFFLCDYGLPLLPTSQGGGVPTERGSWSWESLAENIQTEGNIASYTAIANLCNVDKRSVERTALLTDSLKGNIEEFGRSTVMLLAKVGQIGGTAARSPSVQNEDASLRGNQDYTTETKAGVILKGWASYLQIAGEGGQPVPFNSEDLRIAGVNDKCFSCVTSYDAHDCRRLLSVIGSMTRLRHIHAQHTEQQILGALSFYPDRYKPFNTSSVWWVDADGPKRDLWLIKLSLEKGIVSVIGTDASCIGAPSRTLRQSLVTIADVESRLENISLFLHSHFELKKSARIKEERIKALQALIR